MYPKPIKNKEHVWFGVLFPANSAPILDTMHASCFSHAGLIRDPWWPCCRCFSHQPGRWWRPGPEV